MSKALSRLLRTEQLAFLGRDRAGWEDHLARMATFLGEGLQAADPGRPVLILGAGPGLEVPWALAPPGAVGWDADPWSRVWTALRHRRWPGWVFADLTGGLAELEAAARRSAEEPWSHRRRGRAAARARLAGLLPSLRPSAGPLQAWVGAQRPGAILAANVMGQLGVVAERLVARVLGPGPADPEAADPLAEALEGWTRQAVEALLAVLVDCGAELWLAHDRAVSFGAEPLRLGPWDPDWTRQVCAGSGGLELQDPLAGVDVVGRLLGTGRPLTGARWAWPLAPGQHHLVEALALRA